MNDDRDNVISRWSRLKLQKKHERGKGRRAASEAAPASGDLVPADDSAQAEIIAQLPDIETLEEGSDFTVFLKEGVPEVLRRRALRKLWRLNPVFANLDGLNDYDEDFTIVTTLVENLKTVYQVGKGMPDPEPIEEQEGDQVEPGQESGQESESADAGQALKEDEPESPLTESGNEDVALAGSECSDSMPSMKQTVEPEPARTTSEAAKRQASAARRRWAGFTS